MKGRRRTAVSGTLRLLAVCLALGGGLAIAPSSQAAVRHYWVAAVPTTWNAIPNGKDATLGTLYPPSDSSGDVVAAFAQTLDAFRHSYVLYYIPTGVPREGWHDIAVHVTRAGTYDVAARQRYFGG